MARRRKRRSSTRTRRTRRTLPPLRLGQRGWVGLIVAALLVALPPTRHGLVRASRAVARAVAQVRAAEARDREVQAFARQYGIGREMADAIERAARAEGVDTRLAFRLVRVESAFDPRALSPVGAIGLTQLMLPTAAELQPGITRERLYDRDTNLRLGFRYFRRLLRFYGDDVEMALHAYNRGIGTVARIRRAGGDPANGYADRVLGDAGASPVGPVTADTLPLPPRRVDELGPTRLPAGL
ncbi:MAG TPA: transglycosylase SLT domain-containing protein [Longimicrobium sp.]|nr:transglycosylase SLT domain-containing protein [Longimicrobium sp.]